MGRINGTGLRVTRRESLLLQIPVGSRPLSKLNPACASVTISRRGGWGGTILEILPIYFLLLLLLLFQINFYSFERKKKKEDNRTLSIVSSCVYIYFAISVLSSPLFLNFERYTWWWMQKAREREQSRFKKSTNREVSSVANMFRKQGF